jgi:hypothetical protein
VSGGPIAFEADGAGNIMMLDQSNSRVVHFEQHSYPAEHLALASPAVTAAAFDQYGHLFVATVTDLAVFGPQGQAEGSWTGISKTSITSLEVVDHRVYALDVSPYRSAERRNTRRLLLRPSGSGYVAVRDSAPEPADIAVDVNIDTAPHVVTMRVSASGRQYRISTTNPITFVRAVRLQADGTLTFVLGLECCGQGPDQPGKFVLGRISRSGLAHYETIPVSVGYLVNGPGFVINGDGVAVMSSTTTGGVTVSYYRFN